MIDGVTEMSTEALSVGVGLPERAVDGSIVIAIKVASIGVAFLVCGRNR